MFSLGQSHFSSPLQNLCLFPNLEILECSKDLFLSLFLLCIYFFSDFNLYCDYMSKYCLYNNSFFGHSSNFLNSSPLGGLIGTLEWTCSKPKSLVYLHSLLWRNKSLLLSHSSSLFKLTLSFKNLDHILESSFFCFLVFCFPFSHIQYPIPLQILQELSPKCMSNLSLLSSKLLLYPRDLYFLSLLFNSSHWSFTLVFALLLSLFSQSSQGDRLIISIDPVTILIKTF